MFGPWNGGSGMGGLLGMPNYGGLLSPEDQEFLRNQSMMGMAGQLLASSGYSPVRQSFGQSLGQGMLGYQQSQNQATQGLLQNRLLGSKLQEAEAEKSRQAKLSGLLGTAGQAYQPGMGIGMLREREGTGLLGDLERKDPNAYNKFYAGVAGLGGDYTKTGIAGLSMGDTEFIKNAVAAGIKPGSPEFAEMLKQKLQGADRSPYSTLTYGPNGELLAFNNRNENLSRLSIPEAPAKTQRGQSVIAAKFNPALKAKLSASDKFGESIGKETADVGRGLDALTSISDARGAMDKGIYTGYWAEMKKTLAKATPGIDKTKAANTEEFISHIGNVVIPRLKDFGGNDTVEELRYLQKVLAGDIQVEEPAIRNILNSAERKLQAKMGRLGQQAESAGLSGPLRNSSISAPGAPKETSKVIGGKTYIKRGSDWFEQ